MADDDWKKRVGICINFSSESSDEEGVNKYAERTKRGQLSPITFDSNEGSFDGHLTDDILNEYGDYGTTPPRTRISRRQRERRQREKEELGVTKSSPKLTLAKTKRRNTIDSLLFTELLERSENNMQPESDQVVRPESNKRNKRSMKLLRGSERDLKLDISSSEQTTFSIEHAGEDRAESMPVVTPQPAIKVETSNRFLSLTSKLVACRALKKHGGGKIIKTDDHPDDRAEFYKMFSTLIRMGSSDKQCDKNPRRHFKICHYIGKWERRMSREEHLYQNELKDLIWLELQAWHADRTVIEQDDYLCKAREGVADLLNDIMNYRFEQKIATTPLSTLNSNLKEPPGSISTQSSDSGISGVGKEDCCEPLSASNRVNNNLCTCAGCLSMYCQSCVEVQLQALKDVEKLLHRLEVAEALYPSSKAFGAQHPLYTDEHFVGRVKAMCLWYNMTKHHRLKMLIIGKLVYIHQKNYNWPHVGPLNEDDPNVSSGVGTDMSDDNSYQDLRHTSRSASVEGRPFRFRNRTVHFDVDSSSPSDSNNSNLSHGTNTTSSSEGGMDLPDCPVEFYSASMIASMVSTSYSYKESIYPYRKYMEEVLKTRGLRKAINFLEKLHNHVLRKAMITLEKPAEYYHLRNIDNNEKTEDRKDSLQSELEVTLAEEEPGAKEYGEEEELRRYGYWSPEAQSLGLPSYRAAFLFLSRIPLEMIHEFLRMRLEQKPNQPSVLSIRQLMRELKEGLKIAVIHRQRYMTLIHKSLWDKEEETLNLYEMVVTEFEQSMKSVLKLYLEYVQQWMLMVQQEGYQKNLLEEEWCFVRTTCPKIPGGEGMASHTFCHIASSMLGAIGDQIVTRAEQLKKNMYNCDGSDEESSPKQAMLTVCREFQILFNETREKALKAIAFSKTLRKDLEEGTFKEGIRQECLLLICEALEELKDETLSLRDAITSTIKVAEETCDVRDMSEVDDLEKSALVSRCREILHQGYKFGFEYHKEICRLVTGEAREKLARGMISFAQQWMQFVKERCDRGRGLRPRWANQGLDFLMTVCEPQNTNCLGDPEFEALKKSIDECISHVVGTATPTTPPFNPHSPRPPLDHYPRSRGNSPSPRSRTPSYRVSRSQPDITAAAVAASTQRSLSAQNSQSGDSPNDTVDESADGVIAEILPVPSKLIPRMERVQEAIRQLDRSLEEKLRSEELIGTVTDTESEDKIHIKSRSVTFSWQRGIKIGQGRFGKVYTAVNNQTGELMAMKEIQLQPNDHRTIRRVAEELRIFEGIHHNNLVRYYGVEIHREEMLIFMEFCSEGTLESLVAATEGSGLPEVLMRRYTRQLLQAVATLHDHGIVHRDIKSANIFLTDEGNSLKLGDFGSAVKIKAHTTMPGELQGFVGTQAYMAPEVFMKTNTEGHGRAADIWSVGCVVVEMSSGKRPWPEFDSNYQIMFKVGMGETPTVPDSLSDEGHQFTDHCLQHDPRRRSTASELLHHTFVKVEEEDEYISTDVTSFADFLNIGFRKDVKLVSN
ncbi:mitogen-activated protein kinase kinase kinase 4 isoform X1 [Periplaneta americana]|uniref:mitogen-activated protein kinase kinase kinase 4 isoform X1 n=1 Tax=Periplaneta americana TaxID=6978 RepID=UPI0037E9881B